MSRRPFMRYAAWTAVAVTAFFLLASADLALRSRSALLRAERQEYWLAHPAGKAAHFKTLYEDLAGRIKKEEAAGNLTAEQADRKLELAAAERDFRISESSAKQAYLWYRSAALDFSSPLNPWAKRAKKELPAALAAWRKELKTEGLKPEDWMFQ